MMTGQIPILLQLRDTLEDTSCQMADVARLVRLEPLLAARVVALANSVAFNPGGRDVTDARDAINRLGFTALRMVAATEIARYFVTQTGGPKEKLLSARLWNHSVHVASLAYVIAKRVTRQSPETALFAGIVHELGAAYLISRAKDLPVLLEPEPALDRFAGTASDGQDVEESMLDQSVAACGEGDIGRGVFRFLRIPETVQQAIEHLWQGCLELPPATLGDSLLLAHELTLVPSPFTEAPYQDDMRAPPQHMDVLIGSAMISEILADYNEEVSSIQHALLSPAAAHGA